MLNEFIKNICVVSAIFTLRFQFLIAQDCHDVSDCNSQCSICADDPNNDGYSRCIYPFPYMFIQDQTCEPNSKCKDDCNDRGKCVVTGDVYTPNCRCDDLYHDLACDKRSNEISNTGIIFAAYYEFSRSFPVQDDKVELQFFALTRDGDGQARKTFIKVESDDGFYFYNSGSMKKRSTYNYHIFTIPITFPYKPYVPGVRGDILKLKDVVVGYLTDIVVTLFSDLGTSLISYYQNEFKVFVSYRKADLKCISYIKFIDCGPTWRSPVTYTRAATISIKVLVKYLVDGGYVSTSVPELECDQSSSITWKMWKIHEQSVHSETVDEVFEHTTLSTLTQEKQKLYKPFRLEIGKYKVMLEVKNPQIGKLSTNHNYCYFQVLSLPLVAVIDGGSERKVYKQYGLTLSAVRSHDPNMPSTDQDHVSTVWTCVNINNPKMSESFCKPKHLRPSDRYHISSHTLTYGAKYKFVLEVQTKIYADCKDCLKPVSPTFASVIIEVASEKEKAPYDIYITCVENCGKKVLPNTKLFLKANIKSGLTQDGDIVWTYSKEGEADESTDNVKEQELPQSMLIIKDNSLDGGSNYAISLTVMTKSVTITTVKYLFGTDVFTFNGSCSVEPDSGIKGVTLFKISCTYIPGSTVVYEFYDKSSEETQKNSIFCGRMLGSSHTGQLEGVQLTKGNVLVYISNIEGLFEKRHIEVQLTDYTASDKDLEERYKIIENTIIDGDFTCIFTTA